MDYHEWVFRETTPIYLQVYQKLQRSILGGQLSLGENLPPIREMASALLINPNIVARAYRMASNDGLIVLERRKFYKVTDDVRLI